MKYIKLVAELFEYRVTYLVVGAALGNEFTVNLIGNIIQGILK